MGKPIKERGSEDSVTEKLSPAIETFVGGNDDGGVLVDLRNELEEEIGLEFANG